MSNCGMSRFRAKVIGSAAACAAFSLLPGSANAGVTTFSYTAPGGSQTFSVPTTGTYDIIAYGAQGGAYGSGTVGGKGAKIEGFFSLAAGDQITVDVGGQGQAGSPAFGGYGGGGGGGSFVYDSTTSALLVAAGGGGGGYAGAVAGAGLTTLGAHPGLGGAAGSGSGGGGGGFKTAGAGVQSNVTYGGGAFPTLAGGTHVYSNAGNGGFGGGGAAGSSSAGGGGGYSGGNAGVPASGGYSFNSGTTPTGTAGFESGNGLVTFASTAVPEPASAALLAIGGFAAFAGRRRRI